MPNPTDDAKCKVAADWTRDLTIQGWRKWQPEMHAGSEETSRLIINLGGIDSGMRVLDLASGSGDPALSIAHVVGGEGHVIATDMSEGMLRIAQDCAEKEGLGNLSFRVADMEQLPFEDASFDRVTCRFGIMFVPDHVRAMREMLRVLKPGGKVVLVCWAHWDQPFHAGNIAIIKRGLGPAPPPGTQALTPFRFQEAGTLGTAMRQAGLENVQEQECRVPWDFPGSAKRFWEMWYDIAAPYRSIIDGLEPKEREEFVREVLEVWTPRENGPFLHLGVRIVVGVGEKA
ncbi:S-adenosyl-L-methionine-dependent methyltransferase [Dacryopinax primogenitus]|uniref:S-adenosyl-L-methionine-dependent methyltransferase n=1 Tax=Dacryopinax primogenitus (strain DJM 731) TaxID=1858805 RepID=M5GBT7_DACPD|nr:S-adenosyl-L-methionine-dependent methyltransferase [Dacryopinax primogenitus]EJU05905.1 S-adenosyl-L-methionine-dependent methyltransferase [Dacryopinax primogenitus]